jgi:solute carrier family 45 protein 1/2/4
MAIFTISCSLYSTVIEKLIYKLRARTVYVGGLLVYALGMAVLVTFKAKWLALVCCITTGICYATLYTMPFLLVAQYHAKSIVSCSSSFFKFWYLFY